jgi:hypothetical protein
MMTGGANPRLRKMRGNPVSAEARANGELFDTPPDVTLAFMRWLGHRFPPQVWEPFAGKNALSDVMRATGRLVQCSDLAPRAPDIQERDFFGYDAVPAEPQMPCALISNPPFSRAEEIIRHAFRIGVQQMALVLKATYWHAAGRSSLFREHRPSHLLALTWRVDFMNLGRPTTEVVWVVWDRPCSAGTQYDLLQRPKK